MFAVSHTQTLDALPFEPPTQVIWNQGKFKDQFKNEDGVKSAEKFLTSSVEEMKMALRAMGKRSLKELSKKDLVSYDELTSKMVGIPFTFQPRGRQPKGELILIFEDYGHPNEFGWPYFFNLPICITSLNRIYASFIFYPQPQKRCPSSFSGHPAYMSIINQYFQLLVFLYCQL